MGQLPLALTSHGRILLKGGGGEKEKWGTVIGPIWGLVKWLLAAVLALSHLPESEDNPLLVSPGVSNLGILSYTFSQGPRMPKIIPASKRIFHFYMQHFNPFLHFHGKWIEQHTFDLVTVIHCFLFQNDIVYKFLNQEYMMTFSQMNFK